ncbi:hypothetical protein RhiirA4_467661 [Rhizophagus irregularis]|uniref:Uncharacterized protein n=1 Tax=Rhizophagus irregularis TaxID=588596 RepID=A0A2I1GW95_9GLOM|nr:hypothetical protein RhiirA4_467661 [Rhizophagus irregularis]
MSIDRFEKQSEEHGYRLQKQENNIKNTIESRLKEEHQQLKSEYDDLKPRE